MQARLTKKLVNKVVIGMSEQNKKGLYPTFVAINQTRMKEIEEAGTASVGLSCPFCMIMLGNAREEIGATTKPFDVLELARKSMGTVTRAERPA